MKIIKGMLLVIILTGIGVFAYSYYRFNEDHQEILSVLESESMIASTELGPVEYIIKGGDGPIVLFLHGMPGGYDQAPDNLPGYRLLAPSRPGYLRTSLDLGVTPAQQAEVYLALLDDLGIDSVIVLGVSGGGPSALEFAAKFSERTDALIMMEAISQRFPNNGEMSSLMTSDYLYWAMFRILLGTQGLEGMASMQIPNQEQREDVLANHGKSQRFENLLWSVWPGSMRENGWANDLHQVDRLTTPPTVTVPTLIIHGSEDSTVPVEHSIRLAEQVPNAMLHVIDGASHLMPLTHEVEVRNLMLEFLSRNMN
ncbi:MAG: alpha/beta hydrolase [Pseudohongiella sp.]|uniref:alpha/beta fold hydrolase n=1 Tax=Pseudohongiella sp. TaxID=1979412 RepID=UPI0034A02BA3